MQIFNAGLIKINWFLSKISGDSILHPNFQIFCHLRYVAANDGNRHIVGDAILSTLIQYFFSVLRSAVLYCRIRPFLLTIAGHFSVKINLLDPIVVHSNKVSFTVSRLVQVSALQNERPGKYYTINLAQLYFVAFHSDLLPLAPPTCHQSP